MPPTFLLYMAMIGLAWLAPPLLVSYIIGLLVPSWRNFCSNSLVAGAISSVLLTTLFLFLTLLFGISLIGMEAEVWFGLSGAAFSIGCFLYAILQRWRNSGTKKSEA